MCERSPTCARPVAMRRGVSLVLDVATGSCRRSLHWGHDLGDLAPDDLAALAAAGVPSTVPNDLDEPARALALLPEHAAGWNGRPGTHAAPGRGEDWSPRFTLTGLHATADPAGGGRMVATGADDVAGLTVLIELELLPSGLGAAARDGHLHRRRALRARRACA